LEETRLLNVGIKSREIYQLNFTHIYSMLCNFNLHSINLGILFASYYIKLHIKRYIKMINKNKKLSNSIKLSMRKEINKMKTRIFTICIMVVALAIFAPMANADDFKVTGGGWIIVDESRPTFGLQIKGKYDNSGGNNFGEIELAIGNVQYNDRKYGTKGIKMHSTDTEDLVGYFDGNNNWLRIQGSCRIQFDGNKYENGVFSMLASDEGFAIYIYDDNNDEVEYYTPDFDSPVPLGGGSINIQAK